MKIKSSLLVSIIISAVLILTPLSVKVSAYSDDYPFRQSNMSSADPWGFFYRNCTSFVAWRMNRDKGITNPYATQYFFNTMRGPNGEVGKFGNAHNWDNNARAIGFIVDTVPSVGDIAVYDSNGQNHVAYVEHVNADGSPYVTYYNSKKDGIFHPNPSWRANHYITLKPNRWLQFDASVMKQISVNKSGDMWGVTPTNDLFVYLDQLGSWQYMGFDVAHVAVGGNGDVWIVKNDYTVHKFLGEASGWVQISGLMRNISAGPSGELWGVTPSNDVFRYNGNNSWTQISGIMREVSVGKNGTVWGVTPNNDVFRYNGNNSWTQIPGIMRQVSVGYDGDVWGVTPTNDVFQYNGNNSWTHHPSLIFSRVNVVSDNKVWAVTPNNAVFVR